MVGPLGGVVGGVEGLGVEGCAGVVVGVGPVGDAPGWFATVVPGPGGVVVPVVAPVAPPEVAAERLAQKSKAVDAPAASVRFQAAPVTRTVGPDAVQWPLARLVTGPPGRITSVQSTGEVLALVTVTSAQYPRPQSVRIEVVPRTLPPMGCGATTGGDGATVVGGAGVTGVGGAGMVVPGVVVAEGARLPVKPTAKAPGAWSTPLQEGLAPALPSVQAVSRATDHIDRRPSPRLWANDRSCAASATVNTSPATSLRPIMGVRPIIAHSAVSLRSVQITPIWARAAVAAAIAYSPMWPTVSGAGPGP